MAYIVSKQNRFYVVTYDGLDPTTGKERRRWHLAGDSRDDAEAIAANLTRRTSLVRDGGRSAATVTEFVNDTWLPQRVQHLRPSTAHRYRWMIDHYISPTIGDLPIRSLRAEHLNRLYTDLLTTGKRNGTGLSPKTVYDVHVIIRAALKHAVRIHLVEHNVALDATAPRPTGASKDPKRGRSTSSEPSSPPPNTSASTRRCTSLRPPECDVANSPGCAGATGTAPPTPSPSPAHDNPLAGTASRSRARRRTADAASTSTQTPKPSSPAGSAARNGRPSRRPRRRNLHQRRWAPGSPGIDQPTVQPPTRADRSSDNPVSRSAPHPRHPARRVKHTDQGRVRTTRPHASRLHHGHLPTRHSRHGRHCRAQLRAHVVHPA